MGHELSSSGHQENPTERESIVRDGIKRTIRGIMIRGGAVAHSGKILSFRYLDLKTENLSPAQLQKLNTHHVATLHSHEARPILPPGRDVRNSTVHIIPAGVNERLGYEIGRNGGLRVFIEGFNQENETTQYQTVNCGNEQFGTSLVNYAVRILAHEHIAQPFFRRKRYVDEILMEIADTEGIGKIDPKIRNRKQTPKAPPVLIF